MPKLTIDGIEVEAGPMQFPRKRESCRSRVMNVYYVYIMASKKNGVLYVGVTSDHARRRAEHQGGAFNGFTKKYFVRRLVYFEMHSTAESAMQRERQLKKWNREWKINLIERKNPEWKDLGTSLSQLQDPRLRGDDREYAQANH